MNLDKTYHRSRPGVQLFICTFFGRNHPPLSPFQSHLPATATDGFLPQALSSSILEHKVLHWYVSHIRKIPYRCESLPRILSPVPSRHTQRLCWDLQRNMRTRPESDTSCPPDPQPRWTNTRIVPDSLSSYLLPSATTGTRTSNSDKHITPPPQKRRSHHQPRDPLPHPTPQQT